MLFSLWITAGLVLIPGIYLFFTAGMAKLPPMRAATVTELAGDGVLQAAKGSPDSLYLI